MDLITFIKAFNSLPRNRAEFLKKIGHQELELADLLIGWLQGVPADLPLSMFDKIGAIMLAWCPSNTLKLAINSAVKESRLLNSSVPSLEGELALQLVMHLDFPFERIPEVLSGPWVRAMLREAEKGDEQAFMFINQLRGGSQDKSAFEKTLSRAYAQLGIERH